MTEDDKPETREEWIPWLTEGFDRFVEEAECIQAHWRIFNDESESDEEQAAALYSVIKHLENLHMGVTVTMQSLLTQFTPPEMMAELTRERMELAEGVPIKMETVKLGDGAVGFAFTRENVVVPDDISELED